MTHIFLYGPPATGKTTIGEILSRNLKLPFIDLDRVIESKAGMSIPQIMEGQGESAFRDLESSALREITLTPNPSPTGRGESVVALGGGALLRDENRQHVESSGKIVLLTAELDTLLARLNEDSNKRPLLVGDLKSKLKSLLENRREHYDSFTLKLDVDDQSAEQIAHRAQIMLGRHHLSAMGEYDVRVGQIGNLRSIAYGSLIVTDENVAKHHLDKINIERSIIIPAGEEHKILKPSPVYGKPFSNTDSTAKVRSLPSAAA